MARIYNRNDQMATRRRLRNDLTDSERILWSQLRGKGLNGVKFRRQYGVGPYVVDFYSPAARLVVEVDGESHFDLTEEPFDRIRQEYIETFGLKVMRFTNLDVRLNLDEVVYRIIKQLEELGFPDSTLSTPS